MTTICYYGGEPIYGPHVYDWLGNHACVEHYKSGLKCSCCGCMLGRSKMQYKEVDPNRYICKMCLDNAANKSNFEWIKSEVLKRLAKVGFQDIQCDWIDFDIISKQKMMENGSPNAAGYQYATTVIRQDIRVLSYMNKIEFAAILAHELLHSWQLNNNLQEYNDYSILVNKKVCEGFAQMGRFLILNSIDHPYARFKRDELFRSQDPIYGIPFQVIYNRFQEIGNNDISRWYGIIREARLGLLRQLFL